MRPGMQGLRGNCMVISEKQIIQLMRIAEGYCVALHKFGEYMLVQEIQTLLADISDQQSDELKEIV